MMTAAHDIRTGDGKAARSHSPAPALAPPGAGASNPDVVLTVERWGRGWAVFRGKQRLTGEDTLVSAELRRDRLSKPAQPRACLCCGTDFVSEGAHHRMCTYCRSHAAEIFQGAV